jgi:hypothetical protein
MADEEINHIVDMIVKKYVSTENPDRSFVSKSVNRNVYCDLVNEVAAVCELEEVTDVNEDVSFRYILTFADCSWVLELSMVGPFATFMRIDDPKKISLVLKPKSELEKQVVLLLDDNNIQLLGLEILNRRFDFHLNNTETKKAKLYQILFSDIEILPWENMG